MAMFVVKSFQFQINRQVTGLSIINKPKHAKNI